MKRPISRKRLRTRLRINVSLIRAMYVVVEDLESPEELDSFLEIQASWRRRIVRLRALLGLTGDRTQGGKELTKSAGMRRYARALKSTFPRPEMNSLRPLDNPGHNQSGRESNNG